MNFTCSKCMKKVDVTTHQPNCECGGLWDLEFTPPLFDSSLIDRSTWGLFSTGPFCLFKMR